MLKYHTELSMNNQNLEKIIAYFENRYKNPRPALEYSTNYQLLVAVILSAQCTDARVNKVTEVLFKDYGTPQKMITLTQEKLQEYIFSCGFYRNKAKNILSATSDLLEKYGGEVPSDYDSLLALAGVGRKTANVIYSVAFGKPAIAVDTHVFRVSNRLGLASASTPEKTEKQLMQILPKEKWSDCHHYIIFYGREVCKAQKPLCQSCEICDYCDYYNNKNAPIG